MERSKNNKIAFKITKEMSRIGRPIASKPTTRDMCIKVLSLLSGIIFLFNSFVYYTHLLVPKNTNVYGRNSKVISDSKNEKKIDLYKDAEQSNIANLEKLADEAVKQNRETDAIGYYKQVVSINETKAKDCIKLINLLVKNKQYEESLKFLDKLLSIQPSNISALKVKASSLYALKRYDQAIKIFNTVVEANPNDGNSYKLMGDISLIQSKFDDSIVYYKKALSINDKDVPVYQNIGLAEASIGKYEEALKYYDKGLELDSKNQEILRNKKVLLNLQKH